MNLSQSQTVHYGLQIDCLNAVLDSLDQLSNVSKMPSKLRVIGLVLPTARVRFQRLFIAQDYLSAIVQIGNYQFAKIGTSYA